VGEAKTRSRAPMPRTAAPQSSNLAKLEQLSQLAGKGEQNQ
jgi:hypothetical protein